MRATCSGRRSAISSPGFWDWVSWRWRSASSPDAGGGRGADRSAFLSAFFALVGLHGLHVTIGLLWLGTMMAQFWAKGFRADIMRRGLCFALFWHALDIIWVGIFTNVYLLGTIP